MRCVLLSSLLVVLCACGVTSGEERSPVGDFVETGSVAAALDEAPAVITFHADGNISLSAPLVKGRPVKVRYAADRLPGCRGEQNGQPAWSITGYWQLNGGEVGSFEAGGYSPSQGTQEPLFALDAPGELQLWFQVTNRWGCSAWDSRYGHNYRFAVQGTPTLHFYRDWTSSVDGMPGVSSELIIDYDIARLPRCRQGYNGLPTWEVLVYYRFDNGPAAYATLTRVEGTQRLAAPATLRIPSGASEIEMWFHNSDRGGCVAYDSRFGENYRYRLR